MWKYAKVQRATKNERQCQKRHEDKYRRQVIESKLFFPLKQTNPNINYIFTHVNRMLAANRHDYEDIRPVNKSFR